MAGRRVGQALVSQHTAAADLLLLEAFKDVKSPIQSLVLQETKLSRCVEKPRGHYHYPEFSRSRKSNEREQGGSEMEARGSHWLGVHGAPALFKSLMKAAWLHRPWDLGPPRGLTQEVACPSSQS